MTVAGVQPRREFAGGLCAPALGRMPNQAAWPPSNLFCETECASCCGAFLQTLAGVLTGCSQAQQGRHLGGRQLVDDAVAGGVADQDAAHGPGVVADAAAGRRVATPRLGLVQIRQVRLQSKDRPA